MDRIEIKGASFRVARGALVLARLVALGAIYGATRRIAEAAARVASWAHRAMVRAEMQRQATEAGRGER